MSNSVRRCSLANLPTNMLGCPSRRKRKNGPFKGPNATSTTAIFWNAGGMSSDKYCELKTVIKREDSDIFAIVEAGAATEHLEYYKHHDYVLYTLPRSRQIASGIIVGVRNSLTADFKILHKMQDNTFEAIELNLWKGNFHTKFIFVYNPPGNTPLTHILENSLDRNTIIIGDFNSHSPRWGYKDLNSQGKILEDFIDSSPLVLLQNNGHTFLSFKGDKTNPDLAMIHANIASSSSLKLLESCSGYGHRILCVKRQHGKPQNQPHPNSSPRWNFKKANWTRYSYLTDLLLTTNRLSEVNPDKSWDVVSEIIRFCAIETIPRGRIKNYKPFWTPELTDLKLKRDSARARAELTGRLDDCIFLRRTQALLKRAIKLAKRDCFRNFAANLDYRKDGVRAHRFLSTLKNESQSKNNEVLVSNSKRYTNNSDKALALAKFYSSACRLPKNKLIGPNLLGPPIGCLDREDDRLMNENFSYNELLKAMGEAKKGKCAGVDDLPMELYLNLGNRAKSTLLTFFNIVWKTCVPSEWRKSIILPILKPHKPSDQPSSYRPISLTVACSKLMERMIVNRLNFFLEIHNKISCFQAGFRKKRNTIEQTASLSQFIKDGFHGKRSTLAVYVDFKSAYDAIWIKKLYQKVANMGICGRMYNWIRSFLCQRQAKVKYSSSLSKFVQMRNGLPQGAVISCLLFNIMINDLLEKLTNTHDIHCLAFADDIAIFSSSCDVNIANNNINIAMGLLKSWCDDNQMVVNTDKTVYQLFTLSTKDHATSVKYMNADLKRVDLFSYLGVTFDNKLSWRGHAEAISNKGVKRLNLLKRLTGVTWGSSPDVLATTYKSYVRPILDYGGELLATASMCWRDKVDLIQNKALRLITSAASSTPITALELQTNIEPLGIRREKQLLKLYEKCRRLPLKHWCQYVLKPGRLKTHHSFFSKSEDLLTKYNIEKNVSRQPFNLGGTSPLTLFLPALSLSIELPGRKVDCHPAALCAHALETITDLYPKDVWLHVYTDGSAQTNTTSGSGFYCANLFEGSCAVGSGATNFEAEIEAVNQAICHLYNQSTCYNHVVFLVDSQSAILSLCSLSDNDSSRVEEVKQKIYRLHTLGWTIAFQWIPSHCGIPGNEKADALAKSGCNLLQPPLDVTFIRSSSIVSSAVNKALRVIQETEAKGRAWEKLLHDPVPMSLPRQTFTAIFRTLTGHDYLQEHLHRIGVKNSPVCPLCNGGMTMNFKHLTACTFLSAFNCDFLSSDNLLARANLYWAARREMAYAALSST